MEQIQTIELDCAPMTPRPDTYIGGVIEGTGLQTKEPIIGAASFGNWTWDYSEVPSETWRALQPILKKRIAKLYHSGAIRYGSW